MATDKQAEAALPPGVAKGRGPGTPPDEDDLPSDAQGPGGQTGPQKEIRRFQTRPPADTRAAHEGPVSTSPITAAPTRPHGTGGAAGRSKGDDRK